MSFLKKLFGDNKQNDTDIKPDIDNLLLNDTDKLILDLDTYLCELSSYGDKLEKLTAAQKTFYFNQYLEKEINNGGFNQYFYNSSGDFSHQTIISLRQINAIKTAEILQLAIDQFPNSIVPKDRSERQEILEQIEEKADEVWEQLENSFLEYEDNLYDLNIEFIKQNRSSF
jgi:Domain of unknown function (DUF4375)